MADRELFLVSDTDRVVVDQLHARGFNSVFDIARLPASTFAGRWSDAYGDPEQIHTRARHYATLITQHYHRLTQRHEPALTHARKMDVDKVPDVIEQSLGPELGFEDWFGEAQEFARPGSVESLFSPAAYLAELYAIAVELHPADHPLNLRRRRPDLDKLILSEHTLNGEVTTLELVLQVLEEGFAEETADVHLAKARYPMTLPYHQALTAIRAALDVRGRSLPDVWSSLSDEEAHALSNEPTGSLWIYSQLEGLQLAYSPGQAVGMDMVPVSRFRLMTENKYYCEVHLAWLVGSPFFNLLGRWLFTGGINHGYLESDGNFQRTAFSKPAPRSFPYRLRLADDNSFQIVKGGMSLVQQDMYFHFHDSGAPHTFSLIKDSKKISLSEVFALELSYPPTPSLRETNALSPGLMEFLCAPFDEDELPAYYGLAAPDYSKFRRARDFCQVAGLNLDELNLLTAENRFFGSPALGQDPYEPVPPTVYGAVYVNDTRSHPNDPPLSVAGEPTEEEFKNYSPRRLHRINQWIRLNRATGLDFTQLDWAYQLTQTLHRPGESGEFWVPQMTISGIGPLLELLGQYRQMKERLSVPFDEFCAYFGDLNGYAEKGKTSFYDHIFNPQGSHRDPLNLPVPFPVKFDPADDVSRTIRLRLCRGLQVSDATLCVLARYVPQVDQAGVTTSLTLSQVSSLYRLAAVPRRLGLPIFDALALWHLLDPSDSSPKALAEAGSLASILDLLRRTERISNWLKKNELDVLGLHALIAPNYPTVATPELFNWLINLITSVQAEEGASHEPMRDETLRSRLASHLATAMTVKPLVAVKLSRWADHVCTTVESLKNYRLETFWRDATAWYAGQKNEPESTPARDLVFRLSQEYPQLIQYTFVLNQLALWQRQANLNEQDLGFIVDTPAQLISTEDATGTRTPWLPSLPLLMWILRFKAWQLQIEVPAEEALQYFTSATDGRLAAEARTLWARQELARIHGWREDQVAYVMIWLFGEEGLPTSFDTLYRVIVRIAIAAELDIGVQDVECLERLTEQDDEAAFDRLAASLEAGLPW